MPAHPIRFEVRCALAICVCVLVAAALTACSPKQRGSTSSACGTLPSHPPQDPDGTLAAVTQTGPFDGWPYTLRRSALADWRPKGGSPYTVGLAYGGIVTPFQAASFQAIQELLRQSPAIEKVIAVATQSGNPAEQIQVYQSMIDQGADLIVLQPLAASAFAPRIRSALDQGIATLVLLNVVDDASAVNYAPNVYTSAGATLARFVKLLGGKGNLLGVHGIRATEVDRATWVSFRQVLALCPDIKLVGEIDGNFTPPAVRAAVLQYLATHPGKIGWRLPDRDHGSSIIGAFQQAGRPVPPVTAMAAQKGELAYWAGHAAEGYASAGFAGGAAAFSDAVTRLVLRLLAGRGPKSNMIPGRNPPSPAPTSTSTCSRAGRWARPATSSSLSPQTGPTRTWIRCSPTRTGKLGGP